MPHPPVNRAVQEDLLSLVRSGAPLRDALASRPTLVSADSVDALYAEVLQLAREDLDEAGRFAQAACEVAELLRQPRALGLAFRARANVRYLRANYEAALEDYREAVAFFERARTEDTASTDVEIARTRSSAIQTLAYLARYEEALEWGEAAREVFATHGDTVRLARLEGNLANLYFRLDRFEDALASYERARDEFERTGSPQDLAAVLSNLATCYISVGRFEDSLHTHQLAREHSARHGFSLLVAQADYNVAYAHFLKGDHRQAMLLYAAARKHAASVGDHYHASLCDLDQAEMMLELNLQEEAVRLARLAMRGFRRLQMRYERAKSSVFLAIALGRMGEHRSASRTFRLARQLFVQEGNQVWPALIDLHRALALLDAGIPGQARTHAQNAVLVFSGRKLPAQTVLAELVLSRVLAAEGSLSAAETLCLSATERARRITSPGLQFRCQFLLGELKLSQGYSQEALAAWQSACDALDLLRQGLPEEELRIRFLEDKAPLFERLVPLHLEDPQVPRDEEAAYSCVQAAKSRAFLDTVARRLRTTRARAGSSADPLVSVREQLHQAYMRAAEADLSEKPGESQRWRARVLELEARLKDTLASLRLELGSIHESPAVPGDLTDIAPLSGIASSLSPGQTLIEYFCTPARVYAFVVRRDTPLRVFGLGATQDLRSIARLAQFQLANYHMHRAAGAPPQPPSPALGAHLLRLHRELVEPLLDAIAGDSLLFAPHSFLHGLPFSALGSAENPLICRFRVSRTLSGSARLALSRPATPLTADQTAGGRALVLGVPDDRAPLIGEEARRVAARLPQSHLLSGPAATIQALRVDGARARFIHIASHGFFRSDNPMFSAIRLGDGNLNLYELDEMAFTAELVTLSGCSTGVDAIVAGDELIGLTRGFLHAGARNLLVTLWDVHDHSTTAFMDHFYAAIGEDLPVSGALRSAALHLREQFPHPYHWAAFSLIEGLPPGAEGAHR